MNMGGVVSGALRGIDDHSLAVCGSTRVGRVPARISPDAFPRLCKGVHDCGFSFGRKTVKRPITVWRASQGVSGQIDKLGVFDLVINDVTLGIRQQHLYGNGAPTSWLCSDPKVVEVVRVGIRRYIVQANDTITIHWNESFPFCSECRRPLDG